MTLAFDLCECGGRLNHSRCTRCGRRHAKPRMTSGVRALKQRIVDAREQREERLRQEREAERLVKERTSSKVREPR